MSEFSFYQNGYKYIKTATESFQIADTEGTHWIYFDNGVLTETINPTHIQQQVIIETNTLLSIVQWDATNKTSIYTQRETHGMSMSGVTHSLFHLNFGLFVDEGLLLNTITADENGSSNSHAQFGVDAGEVHDEDLTTILPAVTSTTGLPIYYLLGASPGNWRKDVNAGYSFTVTGARPDWNELTGGSYQKTEVTDGDFVLVHVFASREMTKPTIVIMGQEKYGTKKQAEEGAEVEVNNLVNLAALPAPEMRPVATVIIQGKNSYSNDVNARVVSTADGDTHINWLTAEFSRSVGIAHSRLHPIDSTLDHGLPTTTMDWNAQSITNLNDLSVVFITTASGNLTLTPADDVVITNGHGLIVGHTTQIVTDFPSATPEVQILGTGFSDSSAVIGQWSADASGPRLYFVKSRDATIGGNTIVVENDDIGEISWNADDGTDFKSQVARIKIELDGIPGGANDVPGRMVFMTTPSGSPTAIEALRLNSLQEGIFTSHITGNGVLFLAERVAALDDRIAKGQLWVKNTTPNELFFTDDNGTDFQLGVSGAGTNGIPQRATMWADEFTEVAGNWTKQLDNASPYHYIFFNADNNDGDEFTLSFFVKAGTYTLYTLGWTNNIYGMVDYDIDGSTEISGQDWYSAVKIRNVIKSGSVTITDDGYHKLTVTINGKNVSSSNHYWAVTKFWLKPTSDPARI